MTERIFGRPWYADVEAKSEGEYLVVDGWLVEKLCQTVEGLAVARDEFPVLPLMNLTLALFDSFRSACKIATRLGGNNNYNELETELAWTGGGDAMRELAHSYLSPVEDEDETGLQEPG